MPKEYIIPEGKDLLDRKFKFVRQYLNVLSGRQLNRIFESKMLKLILQ